MIVDNANDIEMIQLRITPIGGSDTYYTWIGALYPTLQLDISVDYVENTGGRCVSS
jgi:hypothetical protein